MKKLFPYFIIAVLVVSLFISTSQKEIETIIERTSDTVLIVKTDTVPFYKPKYITRKDTDTIYVPVPSGENLRLIYSNKYYRDSQYEAWVSGYNPSLDSLKVFNNTVTKTINNEVVRYMYPKTTDMYLEVGAEFIDGEFSPNIGVSCKFKNNFKIGGFIGIYEKKPYYGINLGLKLGRK